MVDFVRRPSPHSNEESELEQRISSEDIETHQPKQKSQPVKIWRYETQHKNTTFLVPKDQLYNIICQSGYKLDLFV